MRPLIFAISSGILLAAGAARAAPCVNPAGDAGDQVYNTTYNVMQYCNGSHWVAMGSVMGQGDNLGNHTAGDDLDMSGNLVRNLAPPSANTDAATKHYVDNVMAAAADWDIPVDNPAACTGGQTMCWKWSAGQSAPQLSCAEDCTESGGGTGGGHNCTAPWGASVPHGGAILAYNTTSSPNCAVRASTRWCLNGALHGDTDYQHQFCSPTDTRVCIKAAPPYKEFSAIDTAEILGNGSLEITYMMVGGGGGGVQRNILSGSGRVQGAGGGGSSAIVINGAAIDVANGGNGGGSGGYDGKNGTARAGNFTLSSGDTLGFYTGGGGGASYWNGGGASGGAGWYGGGGGGVRVGSTATSGEGGGSEGGAGGSVGSGLPGAQGTGGDAGRQNSPNGGNLMIGGEDTMGHGGGGGGGYGSGGGSSGATNGGNGGSYGSSGHNGNGAGTSMGTGGLGLNNWHYLISTLTDLELPAEAGKGGTGIENSSGIYPNGGNAGLILYSYEHTNCDL